MEWGKNKVIKTDLIQKYGTPNFEWVSREDAEAEIEKARKEGREEAWRTWPSHVAEHCAKARAEERERIRAGYTELRRDYMPQDAARMAMEEPKPVIEDRVYGHPRTATKPPKIERITNESTSWLAATVISTINALIDAENARRE